jgi:CRP-like cAMP-binding protein
VVAGAPDPGGGIDAACRICEDRRTMRKKISTSCSLCRAHFLGEFCHLGGDALDLLQGEKAVHSFARGQAIFYAGVPAQALYVVRSGRVRVFRTWEDGEELTIRLLGPGEILGYRPLFANESYRAGAEAVVESSVCIIPAAAVRELVTTVPGLATMFLEMMANELRISEDLMMDLLHLPVRQRVARLLLGSSGHQKHSREPGKLASKDLKRKEMAAMIGTTPETFSRVLHAFAAAGILILSRDSIRIRDEALLRRIAGETGPD